MSAPDYAVTPPAERLGKLATREQRRFTAARPQTRAVLARGSEAWLDRVPMHWMKDWPSPFPLVVARARAARIEDIDGFGIDDFCLGDTGSMFGHSPKPVARALRKQAGRGLTYMLPTEAAFEAGRLLTAVFGEYRWQIATTATDANRFAIRVARAVTGRPKVLVFHGSYHGTVDDVMVALQDGQTINRPGLVGQYRDLAPGAVAVEFNDLEAVAAALESGEVAAILTEPAMTNSAMVLPEPGFHQGLRDLADRHGTVLIVDETHTLSSGFGGYARQNGLRPDIFVAGKCVAGGVAAAVWGLSPALAQRFAMAEAGRAPGHSGMGTTLSGNPLQFVALKATLSEVMTTEAYARMEEGAAVLESGLREAISHHRAPWHVVRLGARVEFICAPDPLRNGSEAARAHQPQLEALVHLMLLNRGCLIAPFHNMMLVSPRTKPAQISRLVAAFDEVLGEIFG